MELDLPTTTESESSTTVESDSTIDECQFVDTLIDPIPSSFDTHNTPSDSSIMATDSSSKSYFNLNIYATVPKLTSGTFNDWKLCLTTILGAQRLDCYITNDVKEPTEPQALADHNANKMIALTALHITVDSENFQVIRNCTSPRDAYIKLCKQHDDAGGLSTANIFTDLVSLRLASDGSLADHLHSFRTLHNDLQSNLASAPDISISEPFIAILLIISLPPQYAPLVQSLLTNFETISLARLYSLLKIDSLRNAASIKSETALMTSKTNQVKKKKKSTGKQAVSDTLTCSLGHPGHDDEGCKTQRWTEFMEYDKARRNKTIKSNVTESAQLTKDLSDTPDDALVSYYDEAFLTSTSSSPRDIFDTGASTHMFSDRSRMTGIIDIPPSRIGVASKGGAIWATVKGSVSIHGLHLRNVLHSPELTGNLISIGRLCDDGYVAIFRSQDGVILDKSKKVALRLVRDVRLDRLWHPVVSQTSHHALSATPSKVDTALLWHRRLGHLHPDGVINFLKRWNGITLSRKDFQPCDACSMGKLKALPAVNPFHRSSNVLDLIHTDLMGPITPCSVSGKKYILTFIDDHSRHCTVFLLKSKDETLSKSLEYKASMEKKFKSGIGVLKSDRGGEYSSDEFVEILKKDGIFMERGPANRSTANSVAERFNQTLVGRLRTQLVQSGLPLFLWGELAKYSCLQINCSPHQSLQMQSPQSVFEALTPTHYHPFDPRRLKAFGSLCYAINKRRKSKISPVAQ